MRFRIGSPLEHANSACELIVYNCTSIFFVITLSFEMHYCMRKPHLIHQIHGLMLCVWQRWFFEFTVSMCVATAHNCGSSRPAENCCVHIVKQLNSRGGFVLLPAFGDSWSILFRTLNLTPTRTLQWLLFLISFEDEDLSIFCNPCVQLTQENSSASVTHSNFKFQIFYRQLRHVQSPQQSPGYGWNYGYTKGSTIIVPNSTGTSLNSPL